ncbi:hypothetical protein N9V90_02235 [Endozoicomonas sp.]|nr:hypothetical protein [Endozoicomonas sp.]
MWLATYNIIYLYNAPKQKKNHQHHHVPMREKVSSLQSALITLKNACGDSHHSITQTPSELFFVAGG